MNNLEKLQSIIRSENSQTQLIDMTLQAMDTEDRFLEVKNLFDQTKKRLDDERHAQIKEHQAEVKRLEKDVLRVRDIFKILKTSDSTMACPICLKTQIEVFLSPCGHTYCSTCIAKANNKCFICRNDISRIHNLFFS